MMGVRDRNTEEGQLTLSRVGKEGQADNRIKPERSESRRGGKNIPSRENSLYKDL